MQGLTGRSFLSLRNTKTYLSYALSVGLNGRRQGSHSLHVNGTPVKVFPISALAHAV